MKKTNVYLNTVLFSSVTPMVRKGQYQILQEYDMPELPSDIDPEQNTVRSDDLDFKSRRSILCSLLKSIRHLLMQALVLVVISSAFSLFGPMLVYTFVNAISHPPASLSTSYWLDPYFLNLAGISLLLGLSGFLSGLAQQHYFFRALRGYQILTNAINERIFKHSLRLSNQARQKSTVGDIVNHMSSDSDSLADLVMIVGEMTISLVMIIGVSIMLFQFIGTSAVTALVLLAALVPLTKNVAKKFTHLDEEMLKYRDARVTLMSQILNAVRVVKYFVWEKSVAKSVATIRAKELDSRRKLAHAETFATLAYVAVSTFVLFTTLLVHAWRGNVLDPATIFACLALFNLLEEPFGNLSRIISRVTAFFVAADRIGKFLQQDQVQTASMCHVEDPDLSTRVIGRPSPEISGRDICVQYNSAERPALKNLNFQFLSGESIAIVGAVGSGKSTLLQLLLQEIAPSNGEVQFAQGPDTTLRVAYVPQEAYILSGSLRENVVFGESHISQQDIDHAVKCACLEQDLEKFPSGLATEIGEKGVNLSGGQKQRVSLARAIIRRPNLVLLDDPLSAVDVETEDYLVESLLFGEWANCTRVVVTHRLASLERFDRILFLQDGHLICEGSFQDICRNQEFINFYAEHAKSVVVDGQPELTIDELIVSNNDDRSANANQTANMKLDAPVATATTPAEPQNGRITEDEDREVGSVKSSVYVEYIRSLGGTNDRTRPWVLVALVASTISITFVPILKTAWLGYSASVQNNLVTTDGTPTRLELSFLEKLMQACVPTTWAAQPITSILIYGLLGLVTLSLVLLNRLFWLERGIAAGRDLHDSMLKSVLAAPLRFFDSTPVGRVLQRFSRDLEAVDLQLQWSFEGTVRCGLQVLTSLVLILISVPMMFLVIIPVLAVYMRIQKMYRVPAREAKRLDSISRSPRYAHFKETLQGLAVIRAHEKSAWMLDGFYSRLRHNQRMFRGHYLLNRWFSSRVPLIGGIVSSATAIGLAMAACQGKISPGEAGVVTVYAMSLWEYLNWGVRIFAEVEARMTAVERIGFYSSLKPEDAIRVQPNAALAETWPQQGAIEYRHVKARYASHLPVVLKDVSFKIDGGTRVGVVGRTGSGKSTLFQTLYRTLEIESGEILIDGTDIASVPLERLRKSLAIIPQDPTLFVGTLRENLDCYSEYTESEIWNALENANLHAFVKSLPDQLNAKVSEGGSNFSQGQRQLICLSRALLCKVKVLIMDEATASVDVQTDAIIQSVIRTRCIGMTILIIAHRLGTVADCDQIIEISAGCARTWGSLGEFHETLTTPRQSNAEPVVLF